MKIIISALGKITKIELQEGVEIVLGREDYNINHPEVSRQHLKIKAKNREIYICDVSSNGCYINGERIIKNHWIHLPYKNSVALTYDQTVFIRLENGVREDSHISQLLNAWLKRKNTVSIGRSEQCDIVISDQQVSRNHATIEKSGSTYFVLDHSLNGTYINGKKIQKKTELKTDDVFTIGLHQFSLNQASKHFNLDAAIVARDLSYTFLNGNTGIHQTSFSITKEKMVALMGPSGCGKSTLLQLLNGVYAPKSGSVEIFGLSLREHFELLKQFIGYVPQENIVHEDLTIDQALYFTAKLRLGAHINKEELNERIDQVLENLNIHDAELRKQPIKTLSGGQKKRVSIAVELLTRPKILFLDEPTSPLDPETIEEFLKSLRNLCDFGTTVVLVTHKPEDLSFMDEVIFMGKGGQIVYQGDKLGLVSHFACDRLPQVYHKLSSTSQTEKYYRDFTNKQPSFTPEKSSNINSFQRDSQNYIHQFLWLFLRYAKLKTNNQQNLVIAFSQPVIVALLTFLVFPYLVQENEAGFMVGNMGVLFITALTVIWFGISNSAKEIVAERAIFKREYLFNLAILPFLLSKVAVLLLLTTTQTLLFLILIHFGFPELQHFFQHFLFLGILGLSAVCFGLMLSAWSKTTEAVMTMLPVVLIPQIVLAGIIHPLENKITEFLSFLSLGRWGTEGIGRIQDLFNDSDNRPFLSIIENNLYQNSEKLEVASIGGNVLILLLLSLLFLSFTFFKIKRDHE